MTDMNRLRDDRLVTGDACRAAIAALKGHAVVGYIDEPGMRLAIEAAIPFLALHTPTSNAANGERP